MRGIQWSLAESPYKEAVIQTFDIFFVICLNRLVNYIILLRKGIWKCCDSQFNFLWWIINGTDNQSWIIWNQTVHVEVNYNLIVIEFEHEVQGILQDFTCHFQQFYTFNTLHILFLNLVSQFSSLYHIVLTFRTALINHFGHITI